MKIKGIRGSRIKNRRRTDEFFQKIMSILIHPRVRSWYCLSRQTPQIHLGTTAQQSRSAVYQSPFCGLQELLQVRKLTENVTVGFRNCHDRWRTRVARASRGCGRKECRPGWLEGSSGRNHFLSMDSVLGWWLALCVENFISVLAHGSQINSLKPWVF